MKVTESRFKNRQLHMEDYLQMVSAEQKEYAEVFDYSKIMLTAEDLLKQKAKESESKRNTESLIKRLRAELKRLEINKEISDLERELLDKRVAIAEESDIWDIKKYVNLDKYDKEIMASLIEKAIVIDENTVQVIWKNQDMYD